MQHPDGEWRFGLLYQGVHGDWSSGLYHFPHVADFLLDVPESLLPRPLLVAILTGGLVRIMLPGMASFSFSIRFSRAEVLLSSGYRVLVFSGLSCLLRASYFPGELFQLFQQVLVSDAECLHLSVLAYTISNAPPGGRLSTAPGWSCILGGLALLLLVFRVDTISR